MKYRICVNKYGFFKIQKFIPKDSFLYFFPIKEHWNDCTNLDNVLYVFETKIDAIKRIIQWKKSDEERNRDWTNCEKEY